MKSFLLLFSLIIIISITACNKTTDDVATLDNETISFLQERFPQHKIEYISETENNFMFKVNEELITITEKDINVINNEFLTEFSEETSIFKVQRGIDYYFILNKNNEDSNINNDRNDYSESNGSMNLFKNLKRYDSEMNLLFADDNISKAELSTDDEKCSAASILECMEAQCEDAGVVYCGICAIGWKWCVPALATICAVDVFLEVEQEIYCGSVVSN